MQPHALHTEPPSAGRSPAALLGRLTMRGRPEERADWPGLDDPAADSGDGRASATEVGLCGVRESNTRQSDARKSSLRPVACGCRVPAARIIDAGGAPDLLCKPASLARANLQTMAAALAPVALYGGAITIAVPPDFVRSGPRRLATQCVRHVAPLSPPVAAHGSGRRRRQFPKHVPRRVTPTQHPCQPATTPFRRLTRVRSARCPTTRRYTCPRRRRR